MTVSCGILKGDFGDIVKFCRRICDVTRSLVIFYTEWRAAESGGSLATS